MATLGNTSPPSKKDQFLRSFARSIMQGSAGEFDCHISHSYHLVSDFSKLFIIFNIVFFLALCCK